MASDRDWLSVTHPIYDACWALWEKNERRLRGGSAVTETELSAFTWEEPDGDHLSARRSQATYLNFGDLFITDLLGHMMRQAPRLGAGLNFGALGEVRSARDFARPTEAELVYFNVDGVGNDGSQWDNFWSYVTKMGAATGHRWLFCEAPNLPVGQQLTQQDLINGKRPYLIHWSPLVVPNWNFSDGSLEWAVVDVQRRSPKVVSNALEGNKGGAWKYLLVRAGSESLGPEFRAGGWWLFDEDLQINSQGNWAKTGGQIPMWAHFYQRDEGLVLNRTTTIINKPAMSRSGLDELGNASVSYMNLSSAADFDAWDAAQSMQFLVGVDADGYKLAVNQIGKGSKWIPLPAVVDASGKGSNPSVVDGSQGAVASDVFDKRLATKREEAFSLAMQEVTSAPQSSGASKQLGFAESKAPRLALIASELEQSQNTGLHFLEMRFGHAEPSAVVNWPREFDLEDVLTSISGQFKLEKLSGLKSPTLGAKLMIAAAEERGLMSDEADADKIRKEYETPPAPPPGLPAPAGGPRSLKGTIGGKPVDLITSGAGTGTPAPNGGNGP